MTECATGPEEATQIRMQATLAVKGINNEGTHSMKTQRLGEEDSSTR